MVYPHCVAQNPQISDPPSQFRSSVSRFDSTSTSSPPISRSCFVMESLESDENASKMGTTWKEKQKEENGKALEFPCEWFLGESQCFWASNMWMRPSKVGVWRSKHANESTKNGMFTVCQNSRAIKTWFLERGYCRGTVQRCYGLVRGTVQGYDGQGTGVQWVWYWGTSRTVQGYG